MAPKLIPPDYLRCQTNRPCTWPSLITFMTLGPVSYRRCINAPTWLASDGVGQMTLCDECKVVCLEHKPQVTVEPLPAPATALRAVVVLDEAQERLTIHRHNLTPAAAQRLLKELQARDIPAWPLAQRKVHTQDAYTCTTCKTYLTKVTAGTPQHTTAPTRR